MPKTTTEFSNYISENITGIVYLEYYITHEAISVYFNDTLVYRLEQEVDKCDPKRRLQIHRTTIDNISRLLCDNIKLMTSLTSFKFLDYVTNYTYIPERGIHNGVPMYNNLEVPKSLTHFSIDCLKCNIPFIEQLTYLRVDNYNPKCHPEFENILTKATSLTTLEIGTPFLDQLKVQYRITKKLATYKNYVEIQLNNLIKSVAGRNVSLAFDTKMPHKSLFKLLANYNTQFYATI
jgi:hypothetical protein